MSATICVCVGEQDMGKRGPVVGLVFGCSNTCCDDKTCQQKRGKKMMIRMSKRTP